MNEIQSLNVKDNAAARGAQLFEGLQSLAQKHELIGDVRGGYGLMCALELVSDKATKAPIDKATIEQLQKNTYEEGVMIRVSGPNIIMSPPLIINEAETQKILDALDKGFSAL